MRTALVTGATGFLGGYVVRELLPSYRVRALGRDEARGASLKAEGARFCRGDLRDKGSCRPFFEGVDAVVHAGALSSAWGRWEDFRSVNVEGTRAVAELCVEHGVRRLVFVSSPSIYAQRRDRLGVREDEFDPENRLNGYIRSKIMAEKLLEGFAERGLEVVVMRPRGLIGAGDTSIAPRLLRAWREGGIPLFDGGRAIVDLTCVENVARACRLCMEAPEAPGRAFNITNGEPMEFREAASMLLDELGLEHRFRRLPRVPMYVLAGALELVCRAVGSQAEPLLTRYVICTLGYSQTLDIEASRRILGYEPYVTLAEGVRRYAEHRALCDARR
ncbi:hypothetical protein B5F40_10815 [Gordonibacter sp. An230]|uniref:NAD-dependent epimerase/dehydratase family protein n=1 Tax=Gordonibacter sp. An230 TaxID=1965592 RepID=UPI000B37DE24|nr:NAD-dependent epimerase/dehydratase family protein [Gordonibacter sp. An230]OUO89479.1 hypothetical protein B5F40_10815 [Gordonibacter sp. An230]